MTNIKSRIEKAEAGIGRKSRGVRRFTGNERGQFWETTTPDGKYDYRAAISGMDGEPPEGARIFTAAELEELEAEGWELNVIQTYTYGGEQGDH